MLPSDLDICRLCAASYNDVSQFDVIDDGVKSGTGVWLGVKYLPDADLIIGRGSDDIEDWLHDGEAKMVYAPEIGNVHEGFVKGVPEAATDIETHLRGKPLYYGAHSLGCPHVVFTSRLIFQGPERIVLFGCPRMGDQAFVNTLKDDKIVSYKNRHDPVTDLPLILPPLFPYADLIPFTPIDGLIDFSIMGPAVDHHILNYVAGMEKLDAKQ